jgi:hypothetical protein
MSDSWLFASDRASVRIVRTATLSCAVCGPGTKSRSLSFDSGTQLAAFLRDIEEQLAGAGYRFKGFQADRRQSRERRTTPRGRERRNTTSGAAAIPPDSGGKESRRRTLDAN